MIHEIRETCFHDILPVTVLDLGRIKGSHVSAWEHVTEAYTPW